MKPCVIIKEIISKWKELYTGSKRPSLNLTCATIFVVLEMGEEVNIIVPLLIPYTI